MGVPSVLYAWAPSTILSPSPFRGFDTKFEPSIWKTLGFYDLPLGADKTRHASNGVFSVVSNDKNKNYDTIQSAWEFSWNREQPEVCSFIRLEVMLFQSEDIKRGAAKRVRKKIHRITLQNKHQCAGWLAATEMYQKWRGKYVYHLSVELAKKRTLFLNSAYFSWIFFTSIVISSHFGPPRGLLGAFGDYGSLVGAP